MSEGACPLCDPETAKQIEREFCRLIKAKNPERCREAMRARRARQITKEQLLKDLGVDSDRFRSTLTKAVKRVVASRR